jgi:hypothetical protein
MLMRGDLNKIIEQVNAVTEKLAARISELEDKVKILEAPSEPKKPGRPKKEVEGF